MKATHELFHVLNRMSEIIKELIPLNNNIKSLIEYISEGETKDVREVIMENWRTNLQSFEIIQKHLKIEYNKLLNAFNSIYKEPLN